MAKRILGVVSGKGGVGKTTIAVNLAVLAAKEGMPVVLIDGDTGNPSVGLHLGMLGSADGLQKVLTGKCGFEETLLVHPMTGVRVMPSTFGYESEVKLEKLKELLHKTKYENFIIDTPPGMSREVKEIVSACTDIIIVVTPDMSSTMSAVKMCDMAADRGVKVNGIVLNRVQGKTYEMHYKEIEDTCEQRILATIREDRIVPESIGCHVPVVVHAPKSDVSKSFNELTVSLGLERRMRPVGSEGIVELIKELLLKILGRR
jgi:septum site-determining protein MinD